MPQSTITRQITKPAVLIRLGLVAAIISIPAFANGQTIKAPNVEPFKAIGALLAIKSPKVNACPTQARMAGWITTNKPGTISYMIAKKGGAVSGPYQLEAVKSKNVAMASFSRKLPISQAIDTEYRILVADGTGKVMSNWVPLRASCKIKLMANIIAVKN